MTGLTEAEEISDIAFGYMGSKALFVALDFGIFTHLSGGPRTAGEIARAAGLPEERCRTLMTALTGLGLTVKSGGSFANSPAAESFLVRGARHDFGEYLRLQVARQMYPLMYQIDDALAGRLADGATGSYAAWFADAEQARLYSESQHAGSLGPARGLARRLDLTGARSLLDVGRFQWGVLQLDDNHMGVRSPICGGHWNGHNDVHSSVFAQGDLTLNNPAITTRAIDITAKCNLDHKRKLSPVLQEESLKGILILESNHTYEDPSGSRWAATAAAMDSMALRRTGSSVARQSRRRLSSQQRP